MPKKPKDFVPVQDLAGNLLSPENISFTIGEGMKKRGRPKKYATPEEAKKAKIANTIASAKRRRGKGIREIQKLSKRTDLSSLQNRLSPDDVDLLIQGDYKQPHSNKTLKELKRLLREQHDKYNNYNNEVEPLKSLYDEMTKRGYGIVFDTIKKLSKKAIDTLTNTASSVVDKITDYGNVVIHGRNDYPPKVRKIISEYGGKVITGVSLNRTPLGAPLMTALQIASGNTFSQKLSNTPYDKLFHLFMCVDLGGNSILFEKNEVINAESSCKKPAGTESKIITSSDIPQTLTLNDALEKTRERMGGKFFTYSAKDNNCQDFIVAFLQANNIGGATDVAWVKQETKVLFEGNDRLRKIANTLTDIGAKVNEITTGAGAGYESDSSSSSSSSNGGMCGCGIDFEDMKWGSFSKQLYAYNRTHKPKLDLHSFAMMILANPKNFNKRTSKRANFYINVILKKGSGQGQSIPANTPVLQEGVVDNILDSLGDDELVRLFGGLFNGMINPNQTYRMPNGMYIRLNDEQYARMRNRLMVLNRRLLEAPKVTQRKRPDRDGGDGGGKGGLKPANLFGTGIKKSNSNTSMPNPWIEYVKAYASKHNMKYNEALKDPSMKAGYKKGGAVTKKCGGAILMNPARMAIYNRLMQYYSPLNAQRDEIGRMINDLNNVSEADIARLGTDEEWLNALFRMVIGDTPVIDPNMFKGDEPKPPPKKKRGKGGGAILMNPARMAIYNRLMEHYLPTTEQRDEIDRRISIIDEGNIAGLPTELWMHSIFRVVMGKVPVINKSPFAGDDQQPPPKRRRGKGGGKLNLLKGITDIGTKLGDSYKATIGINPFTVGYDLGHDVIGPAIYKGKKGKGMPTSKDNIIAQQYNQSNLGANGKVYLN